MSVYKDESTNTWRVIFRYTDHTGKSRQSQKRGFATKREALAWERENANKLETKLDMTFGSFVEIYTEDMKNRVKENTWRTKEHIIESKILPHFQKRKIGEILPKEILAWQNAMLASKDNNGKPFSPSYLKTIHNQLSAIFNHACKFYGLTSNPATKVGNMGKATTKEMQIWTQDEYRKFSEQTMDKPQFFYAFEMLYWCGIREGELLALTPADFDFKRQTVTINKSYQRFDRRDVITEPKTPNRNNIPVKPLRAEKNAKNPIEMLRTVTASLGAFLSKNRHNFSSRDLGKILKNRRIFMRTGLTKKQKVTEVYFNEHDDIAEIYTHNTELKKRLAAYAEKYPNLCKQTDDDERGGMRYEIDKNRISIHLVPPYSKERRKAASEYAKQNNKLQNIR